MFFCYYKSCIDFSVVYLTICYVLSTGVLFKNFCFKYEVKDASLLIYNSLYIFFKVLDITNKITVLLILHVLQ